MRYVDEQTKSVGANLGAITVLVRRPEPPNRRAQAIIILPGTQFSPARQVPLAELHAPSDRLPRDPTLTRALALKSGLPAHTMLVRDKVPISASSSTSPRT
jgi:hypothetical protein